MRMKFTLCLSMLAFCFHQLNAQCDEADFEERSGIAVLELESKTAGSWRKESISGASGGLALTYRGTDYFNTPGNSTITYKVKINSAGTYRFIWRNKISIIASSNASTEHNDSWLKINGSNFFGKDGSSLVYPGGSGKSPSAQGSTSNGWFKIYTNTVAWSWSTSTSDNDPHQIYASFNSPGVYSIQVSGRSKGHSIDRMVLYKESSYSSAQAQSLSIDETYCTGGSGGDDDTPTENQSPTVSITSPSNGQTIDLGSNVAINLNANDSDGNITKHEIFVNNVLVDTDGSTYTSHIISNISAGNYLIKAVVADNQGKTASNSINIIVNSEEEEPDAPSENKLPSVRIINLDEDQVFEPGSDISVNLSATDSDGSVVKHQIFINNVLVDTDGSNYTPHLVNNITSGNYLIKAVVTDNEGGTNLDTVTIIVSDDETDADVPTPNLAPSVSFTNLTNGLSFSQGDDISIELAALDSDGIVEKHQIFVNNTLVDTDGLNYTPHVIRDVTNGNYEIRATVTDDKGATNSSVVNVVVETSNPPSSDNVLPTVQFINLSEGQIVAAGQRVFIGLTANDSDGSVVKYQVFVNNDLVDTDGSSYTAHPFEEDKEGNYAIKVEVTDNDGGIGSAAVNIVVGSASTSTTPEVSFNLIDAIADVNISQLNSGSIISASRTQAVNISATVPSEAKSVLFNLSGPKTETRLENFAPFALFGDSGGDYFGENLPSGSYILKLNVYSDNNAKGIVIATRTIDFVVSPEPKKASAILYPNPVQSDGNVFIRLPEGITGEFYYSVSNIMGVQVEQGKFIADTSQKDINLELSNVGTQVRGVYYLKLTSKDSEQIIPIMIE